MPVQITIGLFRFLWQSLDGGQTWAVSEREIPSQYQPVFLGDAIIDDIPSIALNECWRFLYIDRKNGIGIALNSKNGIYITRDAAKTWNAERIALKPSSRLRMLFRMIWEAEKFDSLAVTRDSSIFLCWEDPWIMSGSRTHVVFSSDFAKSWQFRDIGNALPQLFINPLNHIIIPSDDYLWISRDNGHTWKKKKYTIEWKNGDQEYHRWSSFYRISYVTEFEAYAISPILTANAILPSDNHQVALFKTIDGGSRWNHLHTIVLPKNLYGRTELDRESRFNVNALISLTAGAIV